MCVRGQSHFWFVHHILAIPGNLVKSYEDFSQVNIFFGVGSGYEGEASPTGSFRHRGDNRDCGKFKAVNCLQYH